ncbi:Protein of unknown function [Gryllus bimaculatus]|nr:Protein of unknown function [Gryllus bimaculatus]
MAPPKPSCAAAPPREQYSRQCPAAAPRPAVRRALTTRTRTAWCPDRARRRCERWARASWAARRCADDCAPSSNGRLLLFKLGKLVLSLDVATGAIYFSVCH